MTRVFRAALLCMALVVASVVAATVGCARPASFSCTDDADCAGLACVDGVCSPRPGAREGEGEGEVPAPPLVAEELAVNVVEDTSAALPFAADRDGASFVIVTPPQHGQLQGDLYTPHADFFGDDELRYAAVIGDEVSAPAVVHLTVTEVNDAPTVRLVAPLRAYVDAPVAVEFELFDVEGDDVELLSATGGDIALGTDGQVTIGHAEEAAVYRVAVRDTRGAETILPLPIVVEGPQPDCFHLFARGLDTPSGVYTLVDPLGARVRAHCEMDDGTEGFTLVLRSEDGSSDRLRYDADEWDDVDTRFGEGAPGIDDAGDAWLSTWATVPVEEIEIRLVADDGPRHAIMTLDEPAPSLFVAINRRGQAHAPSPSPLPADEWLALVDGADVQERCRVDGLNWGDDSAFLGGNAEVRIGFAGNDQNDCDSVDSYVGFGGEDADVAVGNFNSFDGLGNDLRKPVPGAVLVRSRDLTSLGSRATCADFAAEGFARLGLATVLVAGVPASCP